MDGLLVIDKPIGPTSHDVVARARRILGERRIGHTGTLDPLASGVLPLVIGRATRLARFLSTSDKTYEACVKLGVATDSGDAEGMPIGMAHSGALPDRAAIAGALDGFRGRFLQQPPAVSAKKIDGVRSYKLARRHRAALSAAAASSGAGLAVADAQASAVNTLPVLPSPEPVAVIVHALEIIASDADSVTLRVSCSAGFYVRALARDLGEVLGVGGHVTSLRRIASGDIGLDMAVPLGDIDDRERGRARAVAALIPLGRMLAGIPAVCLTDDGVRRAVHGQDLGPSDLIGARADHRDGFVRLLDSAGALVGVAVPNSATGVLHPAVVLM